MSKSVTAMNCKIMLRVLAVALALSLVVACDLPPFHFAGEEVTEIELIQLEPPLNGRIQKREVLAKERINEFLGALNRSTHLGKVNVRTSYLLKCKLKSGGTWELKATEEMISDAKKNDYYAFEEGASFLRRFFPQFFE